MDITYTNPLDVWQRTGRNKRRQTEETGVEPGDTVNLKKYVIEDSETVYADNSETEDYDINLDDNTLTFTGDNPADLKIHYQTAPVSNKRTVRAIEQATDTVEEETETKYGALRRVKDEVYESDGERQQTFMLNDVPVRNIKKVEYNRKERSGTKPDWIKLEEEEDYFLKSNIALQLRKGDRQPRKHQEAVRVTYDYGYEDVPPQIKDLTEMLAVTNLYKDAVKGAGIDGRDNFSPDTTDLYRPEIQRAIEEWAREYYANFTGVTRYGEEEVITDE